MSPVNWGIYAGIPYMVVLKNGKLYITADAIPELIARGANPNLLNDIGDQDPDDVMAAFLDSLPRQPEQT